MVKALEIGGLALIGIMILSFVGALESVGVKNGTSAVFWACAASALGIIFYRKYSDKRQQRNMHQQ